MNDSIKEKGVELLEILSQAHGAPGQENEVRRIFRKELGEGARTDRAGNIFYEKKGSSDRPRILIPAHMDEVGLAVQAITEEGLLRFIALGGWWAHTLLAKRVRIRTAEGVEIPGVIGAKPPHFLSQSESEKVMSIEEMFIDVGARDACEVRAFGIGLGDAVVPDSPFTRMRNPDLLLSKAFDDRAGLSVVIQAAIESDKESAPQYGYFCRHGPGGGWNSRGACCGIFRLTRSCHRCRRRACRRFARRGQAGPASRNRLRPSDQVHGLLGYS